jgi:glycosyltransferase involved in cell wall biosynthesis
MGGETLKPLIISTFDTFGGAARAAYRLHHGLRKCDVDSCMLVQDKSSDNFTVRGPETKGAYLLARIRANFDAVPLWLYPRRQTTFFSSAILPDTLKGEIALLDPDVIHLHWVSYGFMRIESLAAIRRPIIWTLHDSWAFTGGCHLPHDCLNYHEKCGFCPVLGSKRQNDLSRWVWRRKEHIFRKLNLTIVTPSHWLAECARASSLLHGFRIEVIPNGLDLKRFTPIDKTFARQILDLPLNKKIILFGAIRSTSDKNKGFHLLKSALYNLVEQGLDKKVELVVFGSSEPVNAPDFGLKTHYLGFLHDDISMELLYSAADLLVVPSIQENLPYTIMEAMACGTPSVAFNVGGMPDMIEHGFNGFLISPVDTADLAAGMARILTDDSLQSEMSRHSRLKAEREFAIELVASRYGRLYEEVVCMHKTEGK